MLRDLIDSPSREMRSAGIRQFPRSFLRLKQPRGEVVEGEPPGLPLVSEPLGVAEHHVLAAALLQGARKGFRGLVNALVQADRSGVEVEQVQLLVEGLRV